jgi:hypothetical protein
MKLGKTETDKDVEIIAESRNIVKEILRFGVSEAHKLHIIYFLALELESRPALEEITKILKKYRSGIKPDEETQYANTEPDNSSTSKLLGV